MSKTQGTETSARTGRRGPTQPMDDPGAGFVAPEVRTSLAEEWNDLRLRFVDDPVDATSEAESLVRNSIDEVHERLLKECDEIGSGGKRKLKQEPTEALRERFHRYEAILERLGVVFPH